MRAYLFSPRFVFVANAMADPTPPKTPKIAQVLLGERTEPGPGVFNHEADHRPTNGIDDDGTNPEDGIAVASNSVVHLDQTVRFKIDLRLCTIAGLLCAMDLIDGNIMSSASATSMPADLRLTGNRYSMAIWLFTLAQMIFKLPSTIVMRLMGAPLFFTVSTVAFGLITLCMAYVTTWRQMIALRFLMGMAVAGIYPGLTCLLSAW